MCGILGLIAEPGRRVGLDRREIIALRDRMTARGPDGAGLFEKRNVVFAHRRLAIRDAAGGAQPWTSEDGECVLVYNGELYNDEELREELRSLGHVFRSRCDTETVMAAYRQWGAGCLQRFRGMFALGIYDFRDESLLLARDRFGIKPLFVAEIGGVLAFASSLPALTAHPRFTKRPNLQVLSHYLTTFRLTLGRETVFEGIGQLLPGEMLRWQNGRMRIERYWDYPEQEERSVSYVEAVDEFQELLADSVRRRLVADVPVGMFLSGGVDSSTIACLVQQTAGVSLRGECGGGDVVAQKPGFSEKPGFDEADDFAFARLCAEHAGFDYGEVRVGPEEYYDCWEWMLENYGTPLATPTDVILYRLAERMKRSVGVVLGGEGADELLCGYAVSHWAGYDFDRANQLLAGRGNLPQTAAGEFRESLRRQYGRDRFLSAADHYLALNSLIPTSAKGALFQAGAWKAAGEDRTMKEWYETLLGNCPAGETQRRQTTVLHYVNLEGLLSRLDSATMLASLEARVPYTDHLLVERAFRLPRRYKIDIAHAERKPYLASGQLEQRGSLRSKRLLRSVAGRLMPPALAERKKASFPTPVEGWLCGAWEERVRRTLLESRFGGEIFRKEALGELAGNPAQAGMWLWPLVNVLKWGDREFAA